MPFFERFLSVWVGLAIVDEEPAEIVYLSLQGAELLLEL